MTPELVFQVRICQLILPAAAFCADVTFHVSLTTLYMATERSLALVDATIFVEMANGEWI